LDPERTKHAAQDGDDQYRQLRQKPAKPVASVRDFGNITYNLCKDRVADALSLASELIM